MSQAVERFEIKIHTYCLMTNHYHLLVETPKPNLSQAVKWINVSYAAYFNRKRKRSGHLFQGRFKAILVDADEYLKHLSRYIHLNPIRANMVDHVKDYQWSSYPIFGGYKKAPGWLETGWLLSLFGNNRKRYRQFVEGAQKERVPNPSKDAVHGLILGSVEFVDWIQTTFIAKMANSREKPQLKNIKLGLEADRIIQFVCDEFGCGEANDNPKRIEKEYCS